VAPKGIIRKGRPSKTEDESLPTQQSPDQITDARVRGIFHSGMTT